MVAAKELAIVEAGHIGGLLELGAVAPTGLVLGFGHGVHLSRLVDTIVAAYAAALKGGMTVRLRGTRSCAGRLALRRFFTVRLACRYSR